MLTPFGKALRKLRVEKGLRLLDLAEMLSLSTTFLSAVETGRKNIPDKFVVDITRALNLSAPEVRMLRIGAEQTRKEVRVDHLKGGDRELVAAFARQLDAVPDELKARLRRHVLESKDGEIPFQRKRRGMAVPPLSTRALRDFAGKVRRAFTQPNQLMFPVMDVLEFRMTSVIEDFCLDVRSIADMGAMEGLVIAGTNTLALREDVYRGAWEGIGRDRFTATHEFGHFLLHRQIGLARTSDESTKIYEDAEWQADTFAGSLLFPAMLLDNVSDAADAALRFGITPRAANVMWGKYEKDGLTNGRPARRPITSL